MSPPFLPIPILALVAQGQSLPDRVFLTLLTAVAITALVFALVNGTRLARERVRLARVLRRFERAETDLLSLRKQIASRSASNPIEPRNTIDFRSQFGEDVYLWQLFEGKRTGYYLEVGAYDGRDLSVTWAFEKIGWVGLLIEAIPERADQCRKNRPNSTVVHTALGKPDSPDSIEFTVVKGTGSEAMLSYDPKSSLTSEHLETIKSSGASTSTVTVPMRTMDSVFEDLGRGSDQQPRVDFAIVDVEGAELNLLKGWALKAHKPRVLIVEDNTMGKDPAVLDYLRSQGYTDICPLGLNIVFIHADETELLNRAREMAKLVPWPNFGPEFGVGIGAHNQH